MTAGWRKVGLAKVAEIDRNAVVPSSLPATTVCVGLEDVDERGDLAPRSDAVVSGLRSTKFTFDASHVLYGKLRPYLKKIARPREAGVCSTDLLPLRPGPELDRDYFFHVLRTPSMVALATARSDGANLPRLSPKRLLEFPIPLPPLAEQRRIAAILDKADAVRRRRREAIGLLDEFLRSAFLEMFGDPVRNEKGWERRQLDDISVVTTGNTPPRSMPELYGSDIEWIKSDNINTPSAYLTKAKEGLSDGGIRRARTVGKGAILVTCIAGSRDCIGNVALADRPVAFNQQINAIEPREEIDAHFLYVQLRIDKRLIQRASTDSMKGLVSKGKLEAVQVIVPPLQKQRHFGDLFLHWHGTWLRHSSAASAADTLFNSLAQRAFRGEV